MNKKTITITKEYQNLDNSTLYFEFTGHIPEEKFFEKDIYNLLDNLFQEKETNFSLEMIVLYIRTALKEIRETKLIISMMERNYFKEITFLHGRIQNYLSRQFYKKAPIPGEYQITYDKKAGIHISIREKNQDIFSEKDEYLTLLRIAKKEMKFLNKVQSIQPIQLTPEEKKICTIYQLFYTETPNFSNDKNKRKAQVMLAFLKEYGISLNLENHFYNFLILNKNSIVTSLELARDLDLLSPLGEITEENIEGDLTIQTKEKIILLGTEIQKQMGLHEQPLEWFETLVKVIYIKKYCIPNSKDPSKISEYASISEKSVHSKLKLIKKLDKKLSILSEEN